MVCKLDYSDSFLVFSVYVEQEKINKQTIIIIKPYTDEISYNCNYSVTIRITMNSLCYTGSP